MNLNQQACQTVETYLITALNKRHSLILKFSRSNNVHNVSLSISRNSSVWITLSIWRSKNLKQTSARSGSSNVIAWLYIRKTLSGLILLMSNLAHLFARWGTIYIFAGFKSIIASESSMLSSNSSVYKYCNTKRQYFIVLDANQN